MLVFHVGNVFKGPFGRRNVMFDGGIFRGHAKGVKAHGMKDVVAPQGTETSNDITNGIVPYVPHMKVARRIREHF